MNESKNLTSSIILPNLEGIDPLVCLTNSIILLAQNQPLKDMSGQPIIGLVVNHGENSSNEKALIVKCCKKYESVVVPVTDEVYNEVIANNNPKAILAIKPLVAEVFDLTEIIVLNEHHGLIQVLEEEELFEVIFETIIDIVSKQLGIEIPEKEKK